MLLLRHSIEVFGRALTEADIQHDVLHASMIRLRPSASTVCWLARTSDYICRACTWSHTAARHTAASAYPPPPRPIPTRSRRPCITPRSEPYFFSDGLSIKHQLPTSLTTGGMLGWICRKRPSVDVSIPVSGKTGRIRRVQVSLWRAVRCCHSPHVFTADQRVPHRRCERVPTKRLLHART